MLWANKDLQATKLVNSVQVDNFFKKWINKSHLLDVISPKQQEQVESFI